MLLYRPSTIGTPRNMLRRQNRRSVACTVVLSSRGLLIPPSMGSPASGDPPRADYEDSGASFKVIPVRGPNACRPEFARKAATGRDQDRITVSSCGSAELRPPIGKAKRCLWFLHMEGEGLPSPGGRATQIRPHTPWKARPASCGPCRLLLQDTVEPVGRARHVDPDVGVRRDERSDPHGHVGPVRTDQVRA
jgi:hypothetical protein